MNSIVTFEIAKLLKEKGFDEPCSHAYKEVESPVLYIHQDKKYNNSFKKEWQNTVRKNSHMDNATINRYSAPTITEVVMWSFNTHKIWSTVDVNINGKFNYLLRQFNSKDRAWEVRNLISISEYFKNPTEAYLAAIEYTLNNLI